MGWGEVGWGRRDPKGERGRGGSRLGRGRMTPESRHGHGKRDGRQYREHAHELARRRENCAMHKQEQF